MIEIGLCADENFAMPCGVCITSIFESNKNSKIRVHILTNGFSDHSIQLLNRTAKKYNQIIDVYKIDSLVLQGLSIMEGRYPIMIYARLLFPQILDKNISKLIYLDCDIIVVDSITELWNTSFNNKVCLAVTAGNADDMTRLNRINTYSHTYVNSGVIFMNLEEWRKQNLGKKCIEYIFSHPNHFYDQDAINAVLNSDIGIIHFKYNFTVPSLYNENDTFQLHKKWWKSLDEARKHPVIIHYTSTLKPWHKEFKHPSKKYFIDTLRNSLWSDYKINRKYYRIKERIKYAIISNLKNLRDCFGRKLKL